MKDSEKKEPKIIHISSNVSIAAIIGLVLIVSMLTGTFPMLAFLVIGAAIGYFRPFKNTEQLSEIKNFLKDTDNYYYTSDNSEIKINNSNAKSAKERKAWYKLEPKEETKNDSK